MLVEAKKVLLNIILIRKNLIYIYFLHTNSHMRLKKKTVSSKTSSVDHYTKFE